MDELRPTGAGGEVCFDLDKPIVGKPAGRVCITTFGEVRVEHRLLKAPVVFSVDRLLAVVDTSAELALSVPALEREPVALHLPRDGFTPANVGFVFRAPVRLGPFRYGAHHAMPLSRSQRKHGLDIDILSLTVAEPALLVDALRSQGVDVTRDVGSSLARAIPRVDPELEAEVFDGRRRRVRSASWKVLGAGLSFAALIGARASAELGWPTMSRLVLASIAAAFLAGAAVAVARPGPEPRRLYRWMAWGTFGVAVLLLLGAALGAGSAVVGHRYVLLWAAVAGLVAAPIVGGGLRGLGRTVPVPVETDPVSVGRRSGWLTTAAVASIALLAIAGSAALEEAAARPAREVQRALVDDEDLPVGWVGCCGGDHQFRGASLDQHICGGDAAKLPAHEAGMDRSFNKPVPGQPEWAYAHFDVGVFLTASARQAQREFAAIDSPGYVDCTGVSMAERAGQFQSRARDLGHAVYEGRETVDGVPEVVVDRFTIRLPLGDGVYDVVYGHFVRGRVGRAILRLPILVYVPEQVSDAERDDIIRAAVEEVRAADL